MRFIYRRETWVLTIQGWIVTLVSITTLMVFLLNYIHPFLAPTSPIKADILVVEGWVQDYVIKDAIQEFRKGGYKKIITTGLPIEQGFYLAQYKNFAELAAATFIALGFEQDQLIAVPGPSVVRNRTSASATALRQWLANSDLTVDSINLYSYDVHARRSWLIFKQALAPEIKVGVIAAKPLSYDPKHWWVSSEGVRSIISETVAYLYARLIDWRR
ncbi:YdcF family protein [Microcoleus sp. FACHB-SPT15]|nr:YdcF family protein [Microcoleus sp. FACHB-SPT15]